MNKNTANAQQFIGRVGNASTKPSARGVNLLGWEREEKLSPAQQRQALVAAVLGMQAQLKTATKAEKKALGQRICELNLQIKEMKPAVRFEGRDVQSFIIDVVKENTPRLTWQRYMKEAEARFRASLPAEPEQEAA